MRSLSPYTVALVRSFSTDGHEIKGSDNNLTSVCDALEVDVNSLCCVVEADRQFGHREHSVSPCNQFMESPAHQLDTGAMNQDFLEVCDTLGQVISPRTLEDLRARL